MSNGTSIAAWVEEETAAKAKQKAERLYGGKVSAYLASLIRADLEGQTAGLPHVSESDAILRLTRRFHPALEGEMQEYLGEKGTHASVNQVRLIARLLEAVPDFLDHFADDTRSRLRILPEPTVQLLAAEETKRYQANPSS